MHEKKKIIIIIGLIIITTILPVLTAVMSLTNSQPQINPYFVTKQNFAHRHHCRDAATLAAKNIRLTCAQRCCSFFREVLHSRAALLCAVLLYGSTTVPPSLPLFLSLSVSVAQIADGVASGRLHVGK